MGLMGHIKACRYRRKATERSQVPHLPSKNGVKCLVVCTSDYLSCSVSACLQTELKTQGGAHPYEAGGTKTFNEDQIDVEDLARWKEKTTRIKFLSSSD